MSRPGAPHLLAAIFACPDVAHLGRDVRRRRRDKVVACFGTAVRADDMIDTESCSQARLQAVEDGAKAVGDAHLPPGRHRRRPLLLVGEPGERLAVVVPLHHYVLCRRGKVARRVSWRQCESVFVASADARCLRYGDSARQPKPAWTYSEPLNSRASRASTMINTWTFTNDPTRCVFCTSTTSRARTTSS